MPSAAATTIRATCAKGAAGFLAKEIEALGLPVGLVQDSGVETTGTMRDCWRLNLLLATAQKVLYQLAAFRAERADEMHALVADLPWEEWIPADGYLTVASSVSTPTVNDTRYPNLRCKDAIVDRIRRARGRRPDSGNERRGAVVFLYWRGPDCRVYLDTSGESISRRGWRRISMEAPLQESLAAALVRASGWDMASDFVNPMCGSGTLAIEAALLAAGRPSGLLREDFGFMHLLGFDPGEWRELRRATAAATRRPGPYPRIVATDHVPETAAAARKNAVAAGVADMIEFATCDFAASPLPSGRGVVVMNPEYGERLGDDVRSIELYRRIGDFLKQRCRGYSGHIFTGNPELGKKIGLRASRKQPFFNGPLECRLLSFDVYEGRRPEPPPPPPGG